jgi:hypothetical protein
MPKVVDFPPLEELGYCPEDRDEDLNLYFGTVVGLTSTYSNLVSVRTEGSIPDGPQGPNTQSMDNPFGIRLVEGTRVAFVMIRPFLYRILGPA